MQNLSLKVAFVLLCLSSCTSNKAPEGQDAVQYVKDIVADKNSASYLSVFGRKPVPTGDIYVIGSDEAALSLCGTFLKYDRHDNVDGRFSVDYLPDFAGERVCALVDRTGRPYYEYLADSDGGLYAMRENLVRSVVSTLDSLCFVSLYDERGRARKNPAKMIVLADPVFALEGKFDVDTLFTALNCEIPVISPMSDLLQSLSGQVGNALVLTSPSSYASGVYKSVIASVCTDTKFMVFTSDSIGRQHPLLTTLDRYKESGRVDKLTSVIIDDASVDRKGIEDDLALIESVMNKESMIYGSLLSPDFKIYDLSEMAVEKCYSILRKSNGFTHFVSKPSAPIYVRLPKPGSENEALILKGDDAGVEFQSLYLEYVQN